MTEKIRKRTVTVEKGLNVVEGQRRVIKALKGTGDFRGVKYDPKTGRGSMV